MYVVVKFVNKEPIMEQFETFETLHNRYPDALSALNVNTEEEAMEFLNNWKKEYNTIIKKAQTQTQGSIC